MTDTTYNVIKTDTGVPIKAWTKGVPLEDAARAQLLNVARLPFIYKWVAVMPDVHWGIGATVGSVIPTEGAIIPAAVGVDIGCGMMAVRTIAAREPAAGRPARHAHGDRGGRAARPHRQRRQERSRRVAQSAGASRRGVGQACTRATRRSLPSIRRSAHTNRANHLGTLGTGNHFIEVCLDESGAGVVHAALGLARRRQPHRHVLHRAREAGHAPVDDQPAGQDLAYLPEGTEHFDDYVEAVDWAQDYALDEPRADDGERHRGGARERRAADRSRRDVEAVNCHHNYVAREHHFGAERARHAQGRGARA